MGYRGLQSCPRYTEKGPFVFLDRYKHVYDYIRTRVFAPPYALNDKHVSG